MLFLALLTSVFAVIRAAAVATERVDTSLPGLSDMVDRRYNDYPLWTYFHILPGLAFMILGPVQFSERIRRKRLNAHRWSGRIFLVAAMLAVTAAMGMAIQPASYIGPTAIAATYFAGVVFVASLGKAFWHIRRKEIVLHREWMIRAFAIGLAVSTIRLVGLVLFFLVPNLNLHDSVGISFWTGWVINMIGAEFWIHYSKTHI